MKAPFWAVAAALLAGGCAVDGRAAVELDLTPPTLLGISATAADRAELAFSEPVSLVEGSFESDPPLDLAAARCEERTLVLEVGPQTPGRRYLIELTVEDARRNAAQILVALYGFNPEVPGVRINELIVRGTSAHPDLVELRVETGGNMAGLALYNGTAGNWSSRLIFPAFPVAAGDFILAHFKPSGTAEEVDETADRAASGGLDVSAAAYDFWVPESSGLNGNNGVIALYARVGGPAIDAILYSNRTSDSDAAYGGFGTAETRDRAVEIVAAGAWRASDGGVRPEDAVNPEASTSTRSICRRRGEDTDSRADWYIVPTRGSTFGEENLEEEYTP